MIASASIAAADDIPAPAIDEKKLLALVQQGFDQHQTCLTLPAELYIRPRPRAIENYFEIEKRSARAPLVPSLSPFIEAGLLELTEHPDEQRGKRFLFVKITKLGQSALSKTCRNPDTSYGRRSQTFGFRVLDIVVGDFTSLSEPREISCVWHIHGRGEAKATNIASWYNHEKMGQHLNRTVMTDPASATIEWRRSFHGFGAGWKLGSYDFVHSNLVCVKL